MRTSTRSTNAAQLRHHDAAQVATGRTLSTAEALGRYIGNATGERATRIAIDALRMIRAEERHDRAHRWDARRCVWVRLRHVRRVVARAPRRGRRAVRRAAVTSGSGLDGPPVPPRPRRAAPPCEVAR